MSSPNRFQFFALVLVALFMAMACGQKPGVATGGALLPAGASINEQGQVVDEQGNVIGVTGDIGGGSDLGGSLGSQASGSGTEVATTTNTSGNETNQSTST